MTSHDCGNPHMMGWDEPSVEAVKDLQEQQRHNDVVVLLDSNHQFPGVLVAAMAAMAISPMVHLKIPKRSAQRSR